MQELLYLLGSLLPLRTIELKVHRRWCSSLYSYNIIMASSRVPHTYPGQISSPLFFLYDSDSSCNVRGDLPLHPIVFIIMLIEKINVGVLVEIYGI